MLQKIISAILILFAVFMAIKQGGAMLLARPQMMEMFGKWSFSRTGVMVNGAVTLVSGILMLFPKTFLWGNFLMAAGILLIICFHIQDRDLKGVLIELPFMLLNAVIIFLHHPLAKTN